MPARKLTEKPKNQVPLLRFSLKEKRTANAAAILADEQAKIINFVFREAIPVCAA